MSQSRPLLSGTCRPRPASGTASWEADVTRSTPREGSVMARQIISILRQQFLSTPSLTPQDICLAVPSTAMADARMLAIVAAAVGAAGVGVPEWTRHLDQQRVSSSTSSPQFARGRIPGLGVATAHGRSSTTRPRPQRCSVISCLPKGGVGDGNKRQLCCGQRQDREKARGNATLCFSSHVGYAAGQGGPSFPMSKRVRFCRKHSPCWP